MLVEGRVCDARVQFSVSREGVWTVQKVVLNQNHHLASPNKVHKLRSHRRIEEADKHIISQIRKAKIKPAEVYEFFKQWYGGAEKRFRRKLCLSELLEECENCAKSLRDNELDEDHKSRNSTPVTYIPDLPMLKTATKSYTRNIYSEFEEEFKQQFFVSCKLLQSKGTIMTYTVIPMKF